VDAFAAAAAAIHADLNLGVDALLTPAEGGAPEPVRAVMTEATVDAPRVSAQLLTAELPFQPARKMRFAVAGRTFTIENVDRPDPHTVNLILARA